MAENNSFETNFARLEEIVAVLEKGECSLEESMALFEEGVKLSAECDKSLKNANQRLITLSEKENGE